jgi:hypothetical protein
MDTEHPDAKRKTQQGYDIGNVPGVTTEQRMHVIFRLLFFRAKQDYGCQGKNDKYQNQVRHPLKGKIIEIELQSFIKH